MSLNSFLVLTAALVLSGCAPEEPPEDSSMLSDTGTEDLRVPVAAYRTCRVTAQSLTIRNSAGGQQTGILYNGDSFRRYSVSGSWAYGYAPRLNLWGYVMNGYLGGCA